MPRKREMPARGRNTPRSSVQATEKLLARVNRELYRRNAELAVRNKTLALLRKLDEIAMSTLGIEDMTRAVAGAISTELGFELVAVAMLDREENLCRWLGASSTIPSYASVLKEFLSRSLAVPLDARDNVCARVLRWRRPEIIVNLAAVFPPPLVRELQRADGRSGPTLRSSLLYPLRLGDRVLGALAVSAKRDLKELTRYEGEALAGIVGLVAIALEKARIYRDLEQTSAGLRAANTRLEEVDKAKTEFMSIVSHQLYTPLTALRGYLSMLQEGDYGPIPGKQVGIVRILRASTDRLVGVIRNLLDVSRIESGRLELDLTSVDLAAMARELVTELAPNAEAKDVKLVFHGPTGAVPRVVADALRLRQVLLNLVDNAIKYTARGRVEVSVERSDASVLFMVRDTGQGIAAKDLPQLFRKFIRVGSGDRLRTMGTGLGLYLARQIVREHRGEIAVESPRVGEGATFTVRLPVEGSRRSLKAGTKLAISIKVREVGEKA